MKTSAQKEFKTWLRLWHKTGCWRKVSFEDFVRISFEIGIEHNKTKAKSLYATLPIHSNENGGSNNTGKSGRSKRQSARLQEDTKSLLASR